MLQCSIRASEDQCKSVYALIYHNTMCGVFKFTVDLASNWATVARMSDFPAPACDAVQFETPPMRVKRCRHGAVLYNTHDVYIGRSFDLYGEYAESEMGLLGNFLKPGDVAFDVGANIGAHTLFFANRVGPQGRVIAFDPQRQVFQTLCANVALNALGNVMTFHAAAGAAPGATQVPVPDYANEGNFGGISVGQGGGETVQVMALDQMGVPAVALIKIDVEGMELEVLKGAQATLAKHRPALYVENDRREKSAALLAHILGLGYRAYWHIAPLFNANNYFAVKDNVFGNTVSLNVLCLPNEVEQNIQGLAEVKSADDFPI